MRKRRWQTDKVLQVSLIGAGLSLIVLLGVVALVVF